MKLFMMKRTMMNTFKVFDFTGSAAIAIEHGQKLYKAIHPHVLNGELIQLDFTGIKFLTIAFVGIAIGQLLKDIPRQTVDELIEFVSLSEDKRDMIQRVMDRAYKWYFYEQNQA